ncbi:MAG: RtcB family protein [Eubacteriales bacterium]|nr:RtcB family protein [Eubacteriales bacterium]
MKVIYEEGMNVPLKIWAGLEALETGALEQAKHIASLPFIFKHGAVMPDAHVGYGSPIGMVAGLIGYVCPNFVGVDIGCGMCAVKTSLTDISIDILKNILGEIIKVVPVGFNHQQKQCDHVLMPFPDFSMGGDLPVVSREYEKARYQLGTLGGGNHFIEIQKGDDGNIWIMIHSGSRNIGKQVADFYNKKAVEINEKYFSKVPKEWELAFLPIDSDLGQTYLREMQYCVDFALSNRKLIMDRILNVFEAYTSASFEPMINIAHNYARMENHFSRNVLVHRKGATSAKEDEIGIIPGSQGTASHIVKGLGNPDSFQSCSHGAGRKMGRKEAQRTLNLKDEQRKLDDLGIIHAVRNISDLDEATGAYKPIDVVMEEQSDLVESIVKLRPLAVIKG